MEDKLAKLQAATEEARAEAARLKAALELAENKVGIAKDRLRSLEPEAQETLQVTDTNLPELLGERELARERYETAKTRFETNVRYVRMLREKMGLPLSPMEEENDAGDDVEGAAKGALP